VGAIHGALAATAALAVPGDLGPRVMDAHLAAADHAADLGTDQAPRHAVVVGVHVHAAVVLHPPHQLAHLPERRLAARGAERPRLVAPEARDRRLARRAVHAPVRHLARPPDQMDLQRRPAREAAARDGVALDVAHAPLVLALGPGAERRTRHRSHVPVAGEGVEARVEHHLPRARVVALDQRTGVVEQHLRGQPAEMAERALDTLEPGRLPLVPEGADVDPARVAQRGDEQVDPNPLHAERHPALAEVDLHLPARRRLEAHRGQRLRREFAPQGRHGALDRAQADLDAQLGRQLLAHHVRVAPVAAQALGQPRPVPGQRPRPPRRAARPPAPRGEVALHGLAAAAQLGRDPPRAPAQRVQPQHRRHLVRCPHPLPPPVGHGRSNGHLVLHPASPSLRGGGWVPGVVTGRVGHVA
jgi:hypothetical protein